MDPKIVISSKEMHWEFSHLVSLLLDVVRYTLWMADFRGPPSVTAQFDPDNVPIERLFTHGAVVAVPIAFWGVDVQTLRMEGGRTAVTANQRSA